MTATNDTTGVKGTSPDDASPDARPLLHCFDGKPGPEGLAQALARLAELPVEARARLADLVLPNLEAMPEDQLDNRIARACRRNELSPDVFGPALKALAIVFRQAATFDLSPEALGGDLTALLTPAPLVEPLLALYGEAVGPLRREIVMATIATHGKVLGGVEWRIDTVGASNRGRGLNVPIALLTFHYQDGGAPQMLTVQALPDVVTALRAVCDELLNG